MGVRQDQIPEAERDYYLERKYPAFGNLVPATLHPEMQKQSSIRQRSWNTQERRLLRLRRRHRT